jgi:hypothetical protein
VLTDADTQVGTSRNEGRHPFAIMLTVLGGIAMFKVIRWLIETPQQPSSHFEAAAIAANAPDRRCSDASVELRVSDVHRVNLTQIAFVCAGRPARSRRCKSSAVKV